MSKSQEKSLIRQLTHCVSGRLILIDWHVKIFYIIYQVIY